MVLTLVGAIGSDAGRGDLRSYSSRTQLPESARLPDEKRVRSVRLPRREHAWMAIEYLVVFRSLIRIDDEKAIAAGVTIGGTHEDEMGRGSW